MPGWSRKRWGKPVVTGHLFSSGHEYPLNYDDTFGASNIRLNSWDVVYEKFTISVPGNVRFLKRQHPKCPFVFLKSGCPRSARKLLQSDERPGSFFFLWIWYNIVLAMNGRLFQGIYQHMTLCFSRGWAATGKLWFSHGLFCHANLCLPCHPPFPER